MRTRRHNERPSPRDYTQPLKTSSPSSPPPPPSSLQPESVNTRISQPNTAHTPRYRTLTSSATRSPPQSIPSYVPESLLVSGTSTRISSPSGPRSLSSRHRVSRNTRFISERWLGFPHIPWRRTRRCTLFGVPVLDDILSDRLQVIQDKEEGFSRKKKGKRFGAEVEGPRPIYTAKEGEVSSTEPGDVPVSSMMTATRVRGLPAPTPGVSDIPLGARPHRHFSLRIHSLKTQHKRLSAVQRSLEHSL